MRGRGGWGRAVAAAVLGLLVAVGLVVGTTLVEDAGALSRQIVPSPVAGATATSTGSTPLLYLQPAELADGKTLPSVSKTWIDSALSTSYCVTLQTHLTTSDAENNLAYLVRSYEDPGQVTVETAGDGWRLGSTFTVPAVPGAEGFVWDGSNPSYPGSGFQARFAVFTAGTTVELVTESTFGPVPPAPFDSFVEAQYRYSSEPRGSGSPLWVWLVAALVLAVAVALFQWWRPKAVAARRPAAPGPQWEPGGGFGAPPAPAPAPGMSTGPPPVAPEYQPPPASPPGPLGLPTLATPVTAGADAPPPFGSHPAPAPEAVAVGRPGTVQPGAAGQPPAAPPAAAVPTTPAGWYPDPLPDPARPGRQRYWDGSTWTDHYHPS